MGARSLREESGQPDGWKIATVIPFGPTSVKNGSTGATPVVAIIFMAAYTRF